jgi:acetyl-CoA carboxylase biotin carboxylase subunit
MKIRRVLIANRGEIAVRIIRACRDLGVETVLAASAADRESLPARWADRTVCIGPESAVESYLRPELLVATALGTNCDALHPGYGFLAESAALSKMCAENGVIFVGPTPEQISGMGNKIEARRLAASFGIPTLPGSEKVGTAEDAVAMAERIGFPVMMKAAAGGGGRGMKIVEKVEDLPDAFLRASSEAAAAFGDGTLYLERYISVARHVEVQVLGDKFGSVIHLGERDCSLQRRHQKLVEEAPAPDLPDRLRNAIRDAAVELVRRYGYENAGTVEFIVDRPAETFHFLEMNTRIQVEHPVTEMIAGIDIVQEQFRIASGEPLRFRQEDIVLRGHAIECRINAEVPDANFRPNPGRITRWEPPDGPNIRVDSHCYEGYVVPIWYDSMIAKLIVYGTDRAEAIARMRRSLERFSIGGIETTRDFQHFLVGQPEFAEGRMTTRLVDRLLAERSQEQRS